MISGWRLFRGELLCNALARAARSVGFGARKAFFRVALGSANTQGVVDLPAHLETLASALPGYEAREFIDFHTLYPLHAAFLGRERAGHLRGLMLGHGGPRIHSSAGISASSVKEPDWMRICPVCAREQEKKWKETFFLREHQVTGIRVCPHCRVHLLECGVARRHRRTRNGLPAAPAFEIREVVRARPEEVRVARLALEILESGVMFDPVMLNDLFKRELRAKGYLTRSGSVRWHLADDFRAYYGEGYLASIQSLVSLERPLWLAELLRRPLQMQSPVRYLLLFSFLELRLADYRDFSQRPCTWAEPPAVRCEPIWTAEMDQVLQSTWPIEQMSLRAVARKLDVDPMTVKRHAVKLGLAFPRKAKRLTTRVPFRRPPRDWVAEVAARRRAWQAHVETHPDQGRKELRTKAPALYAWLYRHDRPWLLQQRPFPLEVISRCGRVDWAKRDAILSRKADRKIKRLRQEDFSGRISTAEVVRQMQVAASFEKNKAKLPATVRVLHESCEDRVAFARRLLRAGPRRLRPDLRALISPTE